MKAVYMTEHGGTDVLQYGDLPEPLIGPNDVKVRVRAAALNRLDVFTRAGVRGTRRRSFDEPHILGGDAAGDIVEVGSEVKGREIGQRVVVNPRMTCNQCRFCSAGEDEFCTSSGMLGSSRSGSYAEYVAVPSTSAVPIPDSLSYEEAASLPTVYLPAGPSWCAKPLSGRGRRHWCYQRRRASGQPPSRSPSTSSARP